MADEPHAPAGVAPLADEKSGAVHTFEDTPSHDLRHGPVDFLPRGAKYKQFRILGMGEYTWYASPKVQLLMVALVCFLCPGMFNALGGLGGGGRSGSDTRLADNMNTALYSTFAVFGFLGGPFVNRFGLKITLALGGFGYCIYAISLLVSVHYKVDAFNIIAGALLGWCAALLWTAQGTIMISYPQEEYKGRYFAWFWAIFNMGAVIGSLIPLGQNIHVTANKTVTDGTYIAFIILMAAGAALAFFLSGAQDVIRDDGTKVVLMKNPTIKTELMGMWETIIHRPTVVLLFPMFWASNWFYTYQQNAVNGAYFSTRTKALNGLLYYLAQIIGALILGYCLDQPWGTRSKRAKVSWVFMLVVTTLIWGLGGLWEKKYTREETAAKDFVPMDWETPGYAGGMFLYFFYGLYDSLWQASVYWYMGALTNSGRRSANYVGFYKGIQSAGAAVMWSLDANKASFFAEYISNVALLIGSLLLAGPVIFLSITDTTLLEEDLEGTGETREDVVIDKTAIRPPSSDRAASPIANNV